MKHVAPLFALVLLALPAYAEGQSPDAAPAPEMDQGINLMQEGAKLLLRGMMANMEPALNDMQSALTEAEPHLRELITLLGDIRLYHAPEKLENGDILIRRKTPAELKLEGLSGDEFEL